MNRGDRGSAVVEFALVAPLVLLLLLGVLQVVLALHVRATLTTAAAEGARAAALAGSSAAVGIGRTRELIAGNLAQSVVNDVTARNERVGGNDVMTIRVTGVLPLVGLLGPSSMAVEGHAIREDSL